MQQAQRRNNAQSLFGIEQIPSDNQIRNLLDPLEPRLFYPVFSSTFEHLEKAGHLKAYRFFEGCLLVPLAQLSQLRHIETENPLFFNGSSQKVCTTFARLFLQ